MDIDETNMSVRAVFDSFRRDAKMLMRFPLALLAVVSWGGYPYVSAAQLGRLDFPTSAGPEAQAEFVRGMLLLHSFEYDDAAEAFRAAQATEPDFALAYWGEALTYNHPLWDQLDVEAGRGALARLAASPDARLAKAPTEREKDFLRAVENLFGGEGSRIERLARYRDEMRRVYEKYPGDLEAGSLYALSILGAVDGGRDFRPYMKAAAIAEEVFDRNPLHPGAAHYLIHAYDDPIHAPLGLKPARQYSEIAPDAPHALHMPSHIFLALGMWQDVVASNEASWASSVARMNRKNLGVDDKGFHALLWLHYGLLQQGRRLEALKALEQMQADTEASGSRRTRYHLAAMRAHHIVESERWGDKSVTDMEVDVSDLGASAAAAHHFSTAYDQIRQGDVVSAGESLQHILARLENASEENDNESRSAAVMATELIALIDWEEGLREAAIEQMADAAAAEERIPYIFGPPSIVKPSHELLGELLLEVGSYRDALAAFEHALERNPGRVLSWRGKLDALLGMGNDDAARNVYREIGLILKHADAALPEFDEYLGWWESSGSNGGIHQDPADRPLDD